VSGTSHSLVGARKKAASRGILYFQHPGERQSTLVARQLNWITKNQERRLDSTLGVQVSHHLPERSVLRAFHLFGVASISFDVISFRFIAKPTMRAHLQRAF